MIKRGKLIVNNQRLDDVVLWSNTSPEQVDALYEAASVGQVKVWNVWEDESGTMQAWIGNAGLVVEQEDSTSARLACSSGDVAEPDFEHIVVELSFEPA
ncbi:MAG: hypothetical protein AAFV36_07150 [Myxococcota bacterium]